MGEVTRKHAQCAEEVFSAEALKYNDEGSVYEVGAGGEGSPEVVRARAGCWYEDD